MIGRVLVREVLTLRRRTVDVDPTATYHEIGVRSFGRGLFHKDPIRGAELGNKRVFKIEAGDLVISNVFAWEGAIGIASPVDAGRIGSHRFMTFTPTDGRVAPSWLRWWFLSDAGLEQIRHASPGSAGRNRTLAIDRFEQIEIPLPTLEEQNATAARLDRVRDAAEEARLRLLPNNEKTFAVLLPALIDDAFEAYGQSPTRVDELCTFVSDVVHPGDALNGADDFVGLEHIESHTGRRVGRSSAEGLKGRKFRFQPGDVVYGYLRPYLNKVWVADRTGLCSVDQYVLRPRDGIEPFAVACALRSRHSLNEVIDQTHSLQLPRLRSGLLAALRVPAVEPTKQWSLVERLAEIHDLVGRAMSVRRHQIDIVEALVPAALNEAFDSYR